MIIKKAVGKLTIFFVIFGLISSVLFFGFDRFEVAPAYAAAPTFVSFSAIAASTGADVTVTLPTHTTNDILLLEVIVRDTNDTITWPSGWTQIATIDRGAISRYWWAWKRAASSSETNPLVDKSTATGDTYAAVIIYRGATPSGDPWEVKGTPQTTTSDPSVFTGITTLTSDSLVVAAVAGENNNNASITTTSTNPSAYAEHYVESNAGSDGVITFSEAVRTTAGATGNVSVNWNSAIPVGAGGILLALKSNVPPTLSISQPDGTADTIAQNGSFNVAYSLADSDNSVTAAFYYDTNNSGLDGAAMSGGCATAAEGSDVTCAWNTTGVSPGTYYAYGITNDGANPQVSAYSSGVVTINAAPTLSISQPDGTGDTVTQGDSFNVTYTLADTDNVVTAAFFYDADATGLNGTAISGACATAAEGTGVTCSWNTTGVTPGSYYVYGTTNDGTNPTVSAYSTGQITINAPANSPPTLSISQPDGTGDTVTQGGSFNVTYSLADTDNVVTAAFYYDSNSAGLDGTAISGACATAAEGAGATCSWNTTGVTPGAYYVYGITNDGVNPQVSAYSSGTLTVNAPANTPPTLSISQPDGVGDTVTQGGSFNVTYSLADTDNVVTAAFYYDSNSAGLDGTAISGACATAAEGAGATCSWNTTGVTPGAYYVYGITNDGVNPQVSAYSSGTLTVNAMPVINVSTVVPNAGATGGGTDVTISGSNFQSGATITFDGISATDIVFVDSGALTAKTPAHIAGMVDVTVTNPDLTSDTLV
ncbi:MAG: IPT/TIG domain-containing protein, partial [Patescibacteria group bacterium]